MYSIKKNFLGTIFIAGLCIILFASCTKEDIPKPVQTYTIQGLWIGTIQNATSGPQYYSLSIKPDGKLTFEGIALNQEHFGVGTWTLTDSLFTGHVKTLYGISSNVGVEQRITATFHSSDGTLTSGTWQNTNPENDSGTFSLSEVK